MENFNHDMGFIKSLITGPKPKFLFEASHINDGLSKSKNVSVTLTYS
jgi:hypothetical protein